MYIVKFMFDYCARSCIWTVNKEAANKLGEGIVPIESLSISNDLKVKIKELCNEYDSSLNWNDPVAGTPWTSEQIESFRLRAQRTYNELEKELGSDFEVQNLIDMCLTF